MPDPNALASWLAVALFLLGIGGMVLGILVAWRALRPKPTEIAQPLEVRSATPFQTQFECSRLHNETKKGFEHDSAARLLLYRRLEIQGIQIAELKVETHSQTVSLGELKTQIEKTNDRIDAVPERVITLLERTKGLI